MIIAAHVGLKRKWPAYYRSPGSGAAAIWAAVVLFGPRPAPGARPNQFLLLVLDVAMVITFKTGLPQTGYVPLMALTLLPVMVVLDVSWRRAAVALAIIAGTFTFGIFTDPVMQTRSVTAESVWPSVVFLFLCCTVWLAVYAQATASSRRSRAGRLAPDAAGRQHKAPPTRAARHLESLRRALQSVPMARRDISGFSRNPDPLEQALEGCATPPPRCGEATFELHPAVLAGAGLTGRWPRSPTRPRRDPGSTIRSTSAPGRTRNGRILFGVARELLANVARHSGPPGPP